MKDEVFRKKWTKILIIGEEEEIEELENIFPEKYDEGTIIRSGALYLEIVPNCISKGSALKDLIKSLGIDKGKVVAVGDNMNDLELIEEAAYGFAVKSGAERLLKRAKLFAPSNNENAIEYVVKWVEENLI